MATLSAEHKSFIVMLLARFHSPREVRDAVEREYGIEVDPSQVTYYNPARASGNDRLADRWKELYQEERTRYIEGQEEVAIAHERFRLEKLQEILERRLNHSDDQTAMEALKQAARERGKAFTNVRDIQSKGEKVEPPEIFVYGGEAPPDQEEEGDGE